MKDNKQMYINPEITIIEIGISEIIATSGFGNYWAGDEEEEWYLTQKN